MKKKRGLLICLICLLTSFTLSAKGAVEQQGKKTDNVQLRFSFWGGEERISIYNEICRRFEEDHPGIVIVTEPSAWNDYWTKIPTEIAGGDAPDIIQMHAKQVKKFSGPGILMDLNPLEKSGAIDLSNFSQSVIDTGIINGNNLMVSIGITTTGLVYNERIAKELGYEEQDFKNLTWQSYEKLVSEIKKKSNGRYYAENDDSMALLVNTTPFTIFMRSRGKDLFTTEGKIAFSKNDLKDWLSMWQQFREIGAVPTAAKSIEEIAKTFEQTDFVKGTMLFSAMPLNRIKIYADLMPGNPLMVVRMPKIGNQSGEYLEGAHISISAKTKHSKEAAMFVNYFVNSKRSLELYKDQNGFPGSRVMNDYVYTLLGSSDQQASKFMNEVTADTSIAPYVLPPENSTDIIKYLDNISQEYAFGYKTLDQAVDSFFSSVKAL